MSPIVHEPEDQPSAEVGPVHLERHEEIAADFQRAAELLRRGDTRGLAEHLGRHRRARAEDAAAITAPPQHG